MTEDLDEVTDAVARAFPAFYLRFHRRDDKRSELPAASRAVLQHLALTGPVTVGELCSHLDRAQSVVRPPGANGVIPSSWLSALAMVEG